MKRQRGIFLSFEGIEGAGKTTQARLLAERLSAEGHEVVLTFEPGGTVIGARIRDILLLPEHREMSSLAELLLYNAARAQHLAEKIVPSLEQGRIVITDRYTDSTIAYQCSARGIDVSLVESINAVATGGVMPEITLLLDLDPETGLKRNKGVNKIDRFELEDIAFHRKVREGYLQIARTEPRRIRVVDASLSHEEVTARVWEIVAGEMLGRTGRAAAG
ncbi:MAG: dTMP kinase [Nitrospirales bacterium]|nr:dTMP kinase [Nitrospirales bacterium]